MRMKVQSGDKISEAIVESEEADKIPIKSVKSKKAKLSENVASDSSDSQEHPSGSHCLHHKLPSKSRQESISKEGSNGVSDGVHTNMFGINFVFWYDVSIEGKSSMDREEQDWGGRIEFGFSDNKFPKEIEDYFLLMEDECSIQPHHCAARVMGVVSNMRDMVLKPPSYDPRDIVELIERYGDAHIIDSGWREVDTEEWVS